MVASNDDRMIEERISNLMCDGVVDNGWSRGIVGSDLGIFAQGRGIDMLFEIALAARSLAIHNIYPSPYQPTCPDACIKSSCGRQTHSEDNE